MTTKKLDSTETIKCLRCQKVDMYESNAVMYYSGRISEYQNQITQEVQSKPSATSTGQLLLYTAWKKEDWSPEKGTLEENSNRIMPIIQFTKDHIQFDNKEEHRPLLVINEPPEYTCPESLRLSYWNTDNGINRWEDDTNVHFHKYNQSSIAVYIPHFSDFTARNNRFTENIMLDTAFLDVTYDYDFTNINDNSARFQRGSEAYIRPCGWYRKAIRVLDRYEDAAWLGTDANAWPVAYHGTATANALPILRNGLLAGGSNGIRAVHSVVFGPGIYLSPTPSFSSLYARPIVCNGRQYQIMFQVRVKNSSIRKTTHPNIWTCGHSQDIRPYGILFKET